MRIIGGKWRSRRLVRPRTSLTRPIPDRVKQALFDMLGSHYDTPGVLPALRVADVFAGSGSMGLEALSRGAESCSFFERGREALSALRRNIETLGASDSATVVAVQAWSCAELDEHGQPFNLVFLDPPYRDSEDTGGSGRVRRYLRRLAESNPHPPLVILHHQAGADFTAAADDPWQILEQRRFGTHRVTFFIR